MTIEISLKHKQQHKTEDEETPVTRCIFSQFIPTYTTPSDLEQFTNHSPPSTTTSTTLGREETRKLEEAKNTHHPDWGQLYKQQIH